MTSLGKYLVIITFIGSIAIACLGQSSKVEPPSLAKEGQERKLLKEEQESKLVEAQRANLEAQTAYYQTQKQKLEEPTKPKTFLTSIEENPASFLGFSAAIVAFVSFFFNYRSTIISQANTEFYEALQRFGDKNSVALRASSAGILTQMAGVRRYGFWLRGLLFRGKSSNLPYFTSACNQLTFGYLSEATEIGILSITDAFTQLLKIDSVRTTERLFRISERLTGELVEQLASYYSALGVTRREDITDEHIYRATSAGAPRLLVHKAPDFYPGLFNRTLTYKSLALAGQTDDKRGRAQTDAHTKLQHLFFRLERLKRLFSDAFEYPLKDVNKIQGRTPFFFSCDFKGRNFHRFNFENALLGRADLQEANLIESNLKGAWLVAASLKDAKMWKAQINEETDLAECAWWEANYFNENESAADEILVHKLAYKFPITAAETEVHPSVKTVFPGTKDDSHSGKGK